MSKLKSFSNTLTKLENQYGTEIDDISYKFDDIYNLSQSLVEYLCDNGVKIPECN